MTLLPNPKIVIGNFLRETFIAKNLQHFAVNGQNTADIVQLATEHELIRRVHSGLSMGMAREGYREGVYLVKIDPQGFKMRTRELSKGDYLFGQYKPRVEGETPRKKVSVLHVGEAPEAKFVDAVLYATRVLQESPASDADPTADYEIVTFLPKDIDEDEPMETEVLLANHYKFDGGTDTKMSPEEFEKVLAKSVKYWSNRAFIS